MPFETGGPLSLPLSLFLSSPEQDLTVEGEGKLPGQPSQLLFPLPLEIFKERKQSFSWGAGVQPHQIKTTRGTVPSKKTGPQPIICFPAVCFRGSFKDSHLGFSQCSDCGVRGCVFCALVRKGCHFSNFQESLSPFSDFFLFSQPHLWRCVPTTIMMTKNNSNIAVCLRYARRCSALHLHYL